MLIVEIYCKEFEILQKTDYNADMKIGFIPIDNRPVCYDLPRMISAIDDEIELFMPERSLLGDLTRYANSAKLFEWLESLPILDAIIISLDTLAYGGLISSRRCEDSFEEILKRVERLRKILKKNRTKVYAFSSIMRISNNNINEEEKEYWSKYGKKIFDYSYLTHKLGCESCIANVIPSDILDDYLATRKRNFEINKVYLNYQKEGIFDTLVFSKDDCAEYGFNVQEAKAIEKLGGFVKTGADEIPLTLLSRALCDSNNKKIKIAPIFLEPTQKDLISNYEDVSIEKSVIGQIELAGCEVANKDAADIFLYVNNFVESQGEIVMKRGTKPFAGNWEPPKMPYMVADVRYANGADNEFVKTLFSKGFEGGYFYGYSAWNTSANTLGSLISAAVVKWYSKKYDKNAFITLQKVRFLDDWAYQANVRQQLDSPDVNLLREKMKVYEKIVSEQLNTSVNVDYNFPWKRLFEVEINELD